MDKISVLCITQIIEKFNTNDSNELFNIVQETSEWLTKSVQILAELNSFNNVQQELLSLAKFIVGGKTLTRRSCNKLINELKNMQKEMLSEIKIILFVTPTIKAEFKKNIEVVKIDDQEKCIDIAYEKQEELKYLVYMNNEEVSSELENAVDIVLTFEELIQIANICYPLDIFTYDRLYLSAKLEKIKREKSKILLTGSSYTMVGLLEDKMPYSASNVAVNAQDLYYTLLSVKEGIERSNELKYIVSSFAYYFFFSNMNDNPSDYIKNVLSKVNYPVFNKLHGYKGELLPLYSKSTDMPIYEAIIDIEIIRDIYQNALAQSLISRSYYNDINRRPDGGMLSYKFTEKNDEQNFEAAKARANGHNSNFNLERGLYNQKLLDTFLDDMEELGKKIILFIPPATKFYRENVSKDMINSYNQLVMPIVEKHKCCKLINLFESEEFTNDDFQDYDHLNINGANKLSNIIAKYIKESED